MGSGLDTGTLVLDRPALVFSRGRASLRGLTGLVAAVSGVDVGVSDAVSVGAGAELVPLVTLVSPELFSILINKLFIVYHLSGNFSPVKCIHDRRIFYH